MDKDKDTLFYDYLYGKLPYHESSLLESRLEEEAGLKEEYDLFVSIQRATHDIQKDQLRYQLNDIVNHAEPKTKLNIVKWISAAAAIFVGAFLITQYEDDQLSSEELFSSYFTKYETVKYRSNTSENKTKTNKEWLIAATDLLEQNQVTDAIALLQQISDESNQRDKKYWYLGLAQLKLGKNREAKAYFNKLQSFSSYKQEEIKSILNNMN